MTEPKNTRAKHIVNLADFVAGKLSQASDRFAPAHEICRRCPL